MESIRIRLRKKRGRHWEFDEVEIPTESEMERIAAELHQNHVPALIDVLGWKVLYVPAKPYNVTTTEVDPFTLHQGETVHQQMTGISRCVFGHGAEWQVCYTWDRGNDQPPRRIQERGDVVAVPLGRTQLLLQLPPPVTQPASDLSEPPPRIATTCYRILRDTALAREVKRLHGHKCQVCGLSIQLPDGTPYSEAHHIKPLGKPHDGLDIQGNILCLCPNHHAQLDYLVMTISLSDLHHVDGHVIDPKFVEYHNAQVQAATQRAVASGI